MTPRAWSLAAVMLSVALAPTIARADPEGILQPISLGAIGNRQLQATTIGFGIGPHDEQVHFLFHGRALVGPRLSAGMGGVKGGYAFVQREHVHFGIELGVAAGGGRLDRKSAGLIATVEPGLFVRFVTKKLGAIHLDGGWMQPLVLKEGRLAGSAMLTLGWSPFYKR